MKRIAQGAGVFVFLLLFMTSPPAVAGRFGAVKPGANTKPSTHYGKYVPADGITIKKLDDENWELIEEVKYVDRHNQVWIAPPGSIINGASIPRVFWSIIGSPLRGKFVKASVVHDVYCVNKERTWQATHLMFYEAMLLSGVEPAKAKVIYYAVYNFGPRWGDKGENKGEDYPHAPDGKWSKEDVEALLKYIEEKSPTVDELEKINDPKKD